MLRDGLRHPEMSKRLAAAAYFVRHTEAGGVVAGDEVPVEARGITLERLNNPELN